MTIASATRETGNPGDLAAARDSGRLWYALKDRPVECGRPLPRPTRDHGALRSDLDTHGYCFIEAALDGKQLACLRERLEAQLAAERRSGLSFAPPQGTAVVSNLLNKGAVFADLLIEPLVDQIVEYLLGKGFLLSALSATITQPGSDAQGLHIDQHFAGFPAPISLVGNVCWMIDDFVEENGATRLVPGSHLWSPEELAKHYQGINSALDGANPPGTIPAIAPAGTALVFDGRLAHGTGRNVSADRRRIAIFEYCCRGWIRGVENPFLSISDDIMEGLPQKVRDRLGYRLSGYAGGYQMAGNPPPLGVVRPTDQVREMS